MARRPAAKEVGMGNPAEKTTGHLTIGMLADHLPALATKFLRFFGATSI